MKLKQTNFVNITKVGDLFHYEYASFGTSLFKKHYYMTRVESPSPWYTWKEFQNAILKNGYYFEDILEKSSVEIDLVGKISIKPFSDSDIKKYGMEVNRWKSEFMDKAIDKSSGLRKEYGNRSEEERRLYAGFFY